MIIKNNIYNLNDDKCYLKDSKNRIFPVITDNDFTYVYNTNNIDYLDDLRYFKGIGTYRIDLFDEDAIKTQLIISKLKRNVGEQNGFKTMQN